MIQFYLDRRNSVCAALLSHIIILTVYKYCTVLEAEVINTLKKILQLYQNCNTSLLLYGRTLSHALAGTYSSAQFYPSCRQIKIFGSGTSTGPSVKVAIPVVYKSTDLGISYDMYTEQTYPVAGPDVLT